MSSPAAASSSDRKKPAEQITFRFCSECSNMLYPKEDEAERKLMFTCRTCNFSEEATSSCIFRNTMNNAVGETAGVTQDVGSDPTVGGFSSLPLDTDPSKLRGSPSFSNLPSSSTASASVSSCLGCGRMIAYQTFGDHLEMLSTESGTAELESDEDSWRGFSQNVDMDGDGELDVDLDDVEIMTWTGESLDELGAFMSRTEDFFGLGSMDLGMEKAESSLSASLLRPQARGLTMSIAQLPRAKRSCPACQHDEAVFFQSQQRSAETGMKLFYVCCECGNIFQ
ncbi:hypothetical protein C7999DRAFT_16978 [Corynascus novoguineensis]|uniref:DNA-directed RNA polymerase II subunit RPB9 n=1 Tax=Corynascus novoguineensis TaxID=1126955 RepID=A0AAN7CP09_9PEZI|nr:hypothetical protein C7999DRAFT_16978 [Corynascus novoguineensis]